MSAEARVRQNTALKFRSIANVLKDVKTLLQHEA